MCPSHALSMPSVQFSGVGTQTPESGGGPFEPSEPSGRVGPPPSSIDPSAASADVVASLPSPVSSSSAASASAVAPSSGGLASNASIAWVASPSASAIALASSGSGHVEVSTQSGVPHPSTTRAMPHTTPPPAIRANIRRENPIRLRYSLTALDGFGANFAAAWCGYAHAVVLGIVWESGGTR
jgi:hypothetical protein